MSADKQIPGDIMTRAEAVYDALGRGSTADAEIIARAIAAERERCAKAAEMYAEAFIEGMVHYGAADKDAGRGRQEGHIDAGQAIASAIRGGS